MCISKDVTSVTAADSAIAACETNGVERQFCCNKSRQLCTVYVHIICTDLSAVRTTSHPATPVFAGWRTLNLWSHGLFKRKQIGHAGCINRHAYNQSGHQVSVKSMRHLTHVEA